MEHQGGVHDLSVTNFLSEGELSSLLLAEDRNHAHDPLYANDLSPLLRQGRGWARFYTRSASFPTEGKDVE